MFLSGLLRKESFAKRNSQKAKAYKHFHERVKMVVIHDQDSSNCKELKTKIENLISPTQFQDYKIRIVCKELENWYFGDIDALEKVIPGLKGKI